MKCASALLFASAEVSVQVAINILCSVPSGVRTVMMQLSPRAWPPVRCEISSRRVELVAGWFQFLLIDSLIDESLIGKFMLDSTAQATVQACSQISCLYGNRRFSWVTSVQFTSVHVYQRSVLILSSHALNLSYRHCPTADGQTNGSIRITCIIAINKYTGSMSMTWVVSSKADAHR